MRLPPAPGAQPQPGPTQVDLENRKLRLRELREFRLTQLVFETLERRARQHLALQAFSRRAPRTRADREVDAADLGYRAQAFLDDRLAQEAGAAGDQYGLAFEGLGDQFRLILESAVGRPAIQPVQGRPSGYGLHPSRPHRSNRGWW